MIHLVVALRPEARPIIARYRLKRVAQDGGFEVYVAGNKRLVLSGVGKVAAAGATAFLQGLAASDHGKSTAWLNVGVAGHRQRPLGEPILAHKVVDASTARSHYPAFIFQPTCATDNVVSFDQPVTLPYPSDAACDMEASGFYSTATRFSTVELVHCLKIISDNTTSPRTRPAAETVEELINAQFDLMDGLVDRLEAASEAQTQIHRLPTALDDYLERWHFTVTQRRQLKHLLQRQRALASPQDPFPDGVTELRTAGEVLCLLRRVVSQLPLGDLKG